MIENWTLDPGWLSGLLRSSDDPPTIALLEQIRRSRNLLLLRGLLDCAESHRVAAAQKARLRDSYAALSLTESASPRGTAGLLMHPHVAAWLTACLKRLLSTREQSQSRPIWADLGGLGAVAIAAAVATRTEVQAAVPACDGWAFIPTVGSVQVSDDHGWRMTPVRCLPDGTLRAGGRGELIVPGQRGQALTEIRRLQAACNGLTIDLELDDLDPYRDGHALGASDRLTEGEVARWRRILADAWEILTARHLGVAASVNRQLVTLLPLSARGMSGISATSRHAPGAVAMTPPRDGTGFACTLIHELQHSKLCLFMELFPLGDAARGRLFYSPWRDDPRPLAGLLHGLYAAVAVADFWRTEKEIGRAGPIAAFQHARARRQIEAGLNSLSAAGPLSGASETLVSAVRDVASASPDAPVPAHCARLAQDITLDHVVRWRLRNVRPADRDVALLAACWRMGRPPRPPAATVIVSGGGESFVEDARLRLAYAGLLAAAACDDTAAPPGLADPDIRLLSGDYGSAAMAFEADIKIGAPRPGAWAGLAVALNGQGDEAAGPLLSRPELVRAVYEDLAGNATAAPSPLEIARWLIPVVPGEAK